jgi:hypothetical protein
MASTAVVLYVKDEPDTRLALHRNTRRSARRATGPSCSRLESRMPALRMTIVVDLIRRLAVQEDVRTVLVEPFRKDGQLNSEVSAWEGARMAPAVVKDAEFPYDAPRRSG